MQWRRVAVRRRWWRGGAGEAAGVAADAVAVARGAAQPQQSMPSCESGYTYPEPNNSSLRVGHVLRRARRGLRRTQRPDAIGQPVDAHARFRSGRL